VKLAVPFLAVIGVADDKTSGKSEPSWFANAQIIVLIS
jgi:hypothetical protein